MRLNALDWLNFFLADVRGGLGAYLNVFLLTEARWSQSTIGATLSISGLVGIMAHAPLGAFIDRTHAKRTLIVAGAFMLAACGLAIVSSPRLPVVLSADIVMAVLGGVFAPTIAAPCQRTRDDSPAFTLRLDSGPVASATRVQRVGTTLRSMLTRTTA